MRYLLLFILLFVLFSCGEGFDEKIKEVKVGDSISKVYKLVGEPQNTQVMIFGGYIWHNYVDQDVVVVSQADTVVRIVFNAKDEIKKVNQALDSLSIKMKETF